MKPKLPEKCDHQEAIWDEGCHQEVTNVQKPLETPQLQLSKADNGQGWQSPKLKQ
jgi:hypothetical protein